MYTQIPQNDSQNDVTPWPEHMPRIELQPDTKSLQRRLRQLKFWNCVLGFCTALCIVLLAFSHRPPSLRNGSKETSFVPEMPTVTTFFDRDDVYANHSDPAADKAWAALMPTGDGFIIVDEPEKFNLRPGIKTSGGQEYDISVFHQLHCLKYIHTYVYEILHIAQHGVKTEGERYFVNLPDDHVSHCFDYLRQGLMCSADMTVEWPREEQGVTSAAVDGWGVGHQCKSWDAVMEFMEKNRFHQSWELDPKTQSKDKS